MVVYFVRGMSSLRLRSGQALNEAQRSEGVPRTRMIAFGGPNDRACEREKRLIRGQILRLRLRMTEPTAQEFFLIRMRRLFRCATDLPFYGPMLRFAPHGKHRCAAVKLSRTPVLKDRLHRRKR
jgi:hypothetical protein